MLRPTEAPAVEYPASDGEPMAETGFHVTLLVYLLSMLRAFLRDRADVYVGGNMFLFYEEGAPQRRIAPDVFVAFGVRSHERRSWFVWEEGKGPDVVFEITSRSTQAEDRGFKKGLYEWLKVEEYFLFDPFGDYLRPPLQGFRLVNDVYQPMPMVEGQIESAQLGLTLKTAGDQLQLFDRQTGERLLSPPEEAAARQAAEAELARLRAELARLRGEA